MNNLLLGGPASTAVAAIWVCSLFATPASSEMVPLGVGALPGHVGPKALFVGQHENARHDLGTQPEVGTAVLNSEMNQQGGHAHLHMQTSGPARFRLSMDVEYTSPPHYQEMLEDPGPENQALLQIGADVLGVEALTSIRILDKTNGSEERYEIMLGEGTLELYLDPGIYQVILEGSLEESAEQGHKRIEIPGPMGLALFAPWILTRTRRRS